VKKPVHACLCFLMTLLTLATFYLELSAQFIAVMQILVYAGAILVIFMFVIILFQDAHQQIEDFKSQSKPLLLGTAAAAFVVSLGMLGHFLIRIPHMSKNLPANFGTAEGIGKALYLDFFFPFEAIILLFLIAVVGALYIAKKER
jgi:NADH-quinone oxidoreductase subunit J